MRALVSVALFAFPLGLLAAAILVPMPLAWQMTGVLLGLLFFQLAVAGSWSRFLPKRRYLRLRAETDRLMALVRELNDAAVQARDLGIDPRVHITPIVRDMHRLLDGLADAAGDTTPPPPPDDPDRAAAAHLDPATASAWKAGPLHATARHEAHL
jgi:hypothetical protein